MNTLNETVREGVCVWLGVCTVVAGLRVPLQRPGRIRTVRYLCVRWRVVRLLGSEVSPVSPVLRQHVARHLREWMKNLCSEDVDSFPITAALTRADQ